MSYVIALLSLFNMALANQDTFILRTDSHVEQSSIPQTSGLKVFWWNIGCSSELIENEVSKHEKPNYAPLSQWKNLENLVQSSQAPDLLILGEYCPKYFREGTYQIIKKKYPHIKRIVKSNDSYKIRNGMRVFSKLPLSSVKDFQMPEGDFLKNPVFQNCDQKLDLGQWTRRSVSFKVEKNSKTYTVTPVHLANPWKTIYKCSNTFKVFDELSGGKQNPNYVQTEYLAEHFSNETRSLILGDFNAPKDIFLGQSLSYINLAQNFGESLIDSEEPTHLDATSRFPSFSLDHAFASSDLSVAYAKIWPLSGSDHLPIYIVVD